MNFTPAGPHFVDTSAAILMMRAGVIATPEALIPFVTYAELLAGVERAHDPPAEDKRVSDTLGANRIVYAELRTLSLYGSISAQLQRFGQPIPMNDLWIAALALQHDLPLLTGDAHFTRVPGLKLLPVP